LLRFIPMGPCLKGNFIMPPASPMTEF